MLAATLAALLLLFTVIALVLVQAFQQSGEQALNERLLSEIYGLLATAEVTTEEELLFPDQFPQFRFLEEDSGLVGEVFAGDQRSLWRSPSMGNGLFPPPPDMAPGESRFDSIQLDGETWYRTSLMVDWEQGDGSSVLLNFSAAENDAALIQEVREFRNTVAIGLTVVGLSLLVIQGLLMRWGLAPLGRAANEIGRIKAGEQQALSGDYPVELVPLTENLNSLLDQQRSHLERYRNALADAAHSIKTPLAALRNSVMGDGESLRQVDAIDRTVEYHLKKAATVGPVAMRAPIRVEPLVEQLVASLKKVYADRQLRFEVTLDQNCQFPGDAGDFLELLGNLLDNGCKWATTEVGCVIGRVRESDRELLQLAVVDDGPGVDPATGDLIVERGVKADSKVSGEGIGLAIVRDILDSYGGRLEIGRNGTSGAKFRVQLPL